MATLSQNALTLMDWAKRLDPDKKTIADIVELLGQTNEMLMDMMFVQANDTTSHLTTVRTGLPAVSWRLLNQGTQPSKSTTAQIREAMGMLDAWSEVDVRVANLGGNSAALRLSEAQAFIEAMNQEAQSTVIYGNQTTAPEEFTGLAPRYADLSAENARCIIDAGGTGTDNSSIWLVVWGPNTVCGIFPKGSQAGLRHEDHGETTVQTSTAVAGTRLRVFQDQWMWDLGLCLKDWRFAARICNIDISNLVAQSSQADLTNAMTKAVHRVQNLRLGRPAFYMNRTVFQYLDFERRADVITGGGLTYANVDGVATPTFRGIPIRIVDALLETEARVV